MRKIEQIPVSILDLATIIEGDTTPGHTFRRSLRAAQFAEQLGYKRYWFAEHHNMESVASSATAVLIGYIAGGTNRIKVGAGGVMLPNHAPLIVAEQFGTLASLYPGRIDLGLGRAPGTDPLTSYALRRDRKGDVDEFPNDVVELINYLGPRDPAAKVRAIPGQDTNVPVWLLGSSTYSAQLAAMLGLPFAFASHFAPAYLREAIHLYRNNFRPSSFLQEPYAMACVNALVADTDEHANFLSTSFYQLALGIFRKDRKPLQPPVKSMDSVWTDAERAGVKQMMHYSFIGSKTTVQDSLQTFVEDVPVDELMLASHVYDLEDRLHSLELAADLFAMEVHLSHK